MNKRQDWYWANEDSVKFLESAEALRNGETVQERVKVIGDHAEALTGVKGLSAKFFRYMARGYYSLASPIWANFNRSGLPISCNNVVIDDSIPSILTKVAEVGMQTKLGAGTSVYAGNLRPRGTPISSGGVADGPVHFAKFFDVSTDLITQGNTRRGACAFYVDVEDRQSAYELLALRENGSDVQGLSLGICIGDAWLESMLDGDYEKQQLWVSILKKRQSSGYPYLFFRDNANRGRAQVFKDFNLPILSSNLCTEIMLPSNADSSFVCDLSSMNLDQWDEWKDTDAVRVLLFVLDAVMEEYINKTKDMPLMASARKFAIEHRAVGIGVLGWHSLLQQKMVPFASEEATALDTQVWTFIDQETLAASQYLFDNLGGPSMPGLLGVRNSTRMAVAPTTSSSFILGQVSPSIEPLVGNYFVKNLAKGNFTYRNPYLQSLLEEKGANTPEVWKSILLKGGSVQHLECLSPLEKEVFKTFAEISQLQIVAQAANRQKYIDQGQSLNLMIPPTADPAEVHELIIAAWRLGLKSLYYQRSANPAQELARSILDCESCNA